MANAWSNNMVRHGLKQPKNFKKPFKPLKTFKKTLEKNFKETPTNP